ncbi:MAG TPA: hypothetical protein VHB30_02705 [Solirubrobacteraceae bacterium]|nr:hypothetical protein [Solirubrobacteraceae bacterium]
MSRAEAWRARLARVTAPLEPWLPALRVARFALAVALVVAMGVLAVRDVPSRDVTWSLMAPAVAIAVAWWVLLARIWAILVSGRPTAADVGTWCRTQVLRYIPGGIWAPTSRVAVVRGSAVDRVATVAAENLVALCAALAIAGVALTASGRPAWAPLLLTALVPHALLRLLGERSRLEDRRVARALAEGLAGFVAYAACAVLVQAAVSGWHDELRVAGAAALAWGAGLVVVFAPGGVGIREVAYVGLLASSFPHRDLVAAAVVMRAVTIAAELLVLVVAGRPPAVAESKSSRRFAAFDDANDPSES